MVQFRTFRGSTLGVLGAETGSTDRKFVFIIQESIVRLNRTLYPLGFFLKEQDLNLYVYSDIVEPHSVGDTQANLLRIVPVKDKEGRFVSDGFATIP